MEQDPKLTIFFDSTGKSESLFVNQQFSVGLIYNYTFFSIFGDIGQVIRPLRTSSAPLLFSSIVWDPRSRKILPVAEFLGGTRLKAQGGVGEKKWQQLLMPSQFRNLLQSFQNCMCTENFKRGVKIIIFYITDTNWSLETLGN